MNISEKEKYIGNTGIGLVGGVAAYAWCPNFVTNQYVRLCKKLGDRFSMEEQQEIWQSAKKVFAESPLKDKVELVDYNKSNWEPIADRIVKQRRVFLKNCKNPLTKLLSKTWPTDEEFKESFYVYAQGKNACYMPATSQILVNGEKRANAVFHEMGHAMNVKSSGFGNMLTKTRGKFTKLVPLIFGISMLTPKSNEDSPAKNKIYKRLLTFKKYSGLMVSACLIPLVAEEGIASIKAAKMAKNNLPKDLYKKMNKSNAMAFCAYTIMMIMAGLGTTFANYIKDKVTGPLPAKNSATTEK